MKVSRTKSVVADLYLMRYRMNDIARLLGLSPRQVSRILRDLDLHQRPLPSVEALPPDMQVRVALLLQD